MNLNAIFHTIFAHTEPNISMLIKIILIAKITGTPLTFFYNNKIQF
jgi:hypothetical protein